MTYHGSKERKSHMKTWVDKYHLINGQHGQQRDNETKWDIRFCQICKNGNLYFLLMPSNLSEVMSLVLLSWMFSFCAVVVYRKGLGTLKYFS